MDYFVGLFTSSLDSYSEKLRFLNTSGTPEDMNSPLMQCGQDEFYQDSLDVPHQSSTGDQHRVRTKVPRVSHTGVNFASMSSVLNKWLFRKMPNSRSCDEFSERIHIVLFTLRDPELYAIYNASADV